MKRYGLAAGLFVAGFIAAYMALCFCVPGWRIKLFAEPGVYFVASVRHMALLKTMISAVVGLAAGAIPVAFREKND